MLNECKRKILYLILLQEQKKRYVDCCSQIKLKPQMILTKAIQGEISQVQEIQGSYRSYRSEVCEFCIALVEGQSS